jgi:CheY-like chemotaxis protein
VAKVLVIESDSVFAAVLADRLHVAGHEVRRLSEGARAVAVAQEQQVDLVVLGTSPGAGLEVIEGLKGLPATRSLPILVLAAAADSVNALRAGADDVLTRPCDLEELLLRLYRLLANRTAVLQVLQGDLANHPLWALLQYLGQVRKTGILRVKATGGSGTLELRDGKATGARWQGLRGREALLALLSLEEGGFRFDPEPLPEAEEGPLPLHELLMQSAWLKDEIAKRRHLLPATGQPLQSLTPSLPAVEHDFQDLPVRRVFERVLQQPGLRLFDLIADETEAPPSTRLALALLVEVGAISPQTGEEDSDIQNTREISTVLLLEIAVEDLIDAATKAGLPATALPYLLLVEPEVWPALRRLIEEAPGFRRNEGMRKLVEQVELRKAGSVSFPGRHGKLSLHVLVITGAAQPQIHTIVPGCAGLLVWIRGTGSLEVVGGVVQRLETSGPRGAGGVLVAGTEAAQQQAAALAGRGTRWRTTPHEPHSLLGLLRLLHPPDARA